MVLLAECSILYAWVYNWPCFPIFLLVYLGYFWSHSRIFFTHMKTYDMETINGEELQLLTYAWHSWPLSSEGSLACHTCCATDLPFIVVISEGPWHSHLLPSVQQWSCHYLFLRLRSVTAGIRTPNLPNALTHRATIAVVFSEDLYCLAEDKHAYISNFSF